MVKTNYSNFVHYVKPIKQFSPVDSPCLLEHIQICPELSWVSCTITNHSVRVAPFWNVVSMWEECCWPYKAWILCHISLETRVTFDTLFRRLRVVLWQKLKQFLNIYEWRSVYIPLFGPPIHWGPISRPVHFTLPQIFPLCLPNLTTNINGETYEWSNSTSISVGSHVYLARGSAHMLCS